jgi:DNA (cytosine-5)-methyltransferase 1
MGIPMTSHQLKNVIDVFCGAGGLSKGFSEAGYNIVTGVDNNKHSLDTYENNHDCKPVLEDVENPNIIQIIRDSIIDNGYSPNEIDLIIGGPPCRGFSMANVQTDSQTHPLNSLPSQFLEIVEEFDPEAVLIENVPRLLTISDGMFKESILGRLHDLGYNVEYDVLKAEQFGVPQKRRRVFFLGRKSVEPELPDPSDYTPNVEIPVSVDRAISDLPELPTGGGGTIEMDYSADGSNISEYARAMRQDEKEGLLINHRTTKNQEKTYKRFEHIPQGGNWKDIPKELMNNYSNRKRTHDHIYQRLSEDEPANTVANFRKQMIVHPTQDRLLSVREAARLQSFPDDYHFKGDSFNARQQMVGDAVPVKLAYAIGKKLSRQHTSNEATVS